LLPKRTTIYTDLAAWANDSVWGNVASSATRFREPERDGRVNAYISNRQRYRERTTVNWLKLGSLVLALGSSTYANAQERNINASYGDADIRTILHQLGEVTKSPVVMLRGVEGRATLVANGPMTADELLLSSTTTCGHTAAIKPTY